MNDILTIILVLGSAIGLVWLIAKALDRNVKAKGSLFMQQPSIGMRIFAFILALIFSGFFYMEVTAAYKFHIVVPAIAIGLFAYSLGATKLINVIQNFGKKKQQ